MAVVLRVILSLSLDLRVSAAVVIFIWLVAAAVPLVPAALNRVKRLAALEIASVLEVVAHSQDEPGETWAVRCSKTVFGGDLLGEEEEDRLEFRISRAGVAPITLRMSGRVVVAPAGFNRTVSKRGLRLIRLKGWFVSERRDTEAEIAHEWNLHDRTYAEIADDIAWAVEALGFSLRKVRLSRVEPGRG